MPRKALLLLLPFLVAACASETVWYKDGMTEAEFKRDSEACLAEARGLTGVLNPEQGRPAGTFGGQFDSDPSVWARSHADIYGLCMKRRNYRRAPAAAIKR